MRPQIRASSSTGSISSWKQSIVASRSDTSSVRSEFSGPVFFISQSLQQQQDNPGNNSGNFQEVNGTFLNQEETRCSMSDKKVELEARIANLQAMEARVAKLQAMEARVNKLQAMEARIAKLQAMEARLTRLEVMNNQLLSYAQTNVQDIRQIKQILQKYIDPKNKEQSQEQLSKISNKEISSISEKSLTNIYKFKPRSLYFQLFNQWRRKNLFTIFNNQEDVFRFIYLSFFILENIKFPGYISRSDLILAMFIMELTCAVQDKDKKIHFSSNSPEIPEYKNQVKELNNYDSEAYYVWSEVTKFLLSRNDKQWIRTSAKTSIPQIIKFIVALRLSKKFKNYGHYTIIIIVTCILNDKHNTVLKQLNLLRLVQVCEDVRGLKRKLETRISYDLCLEK